MRPSTEEIPTVSMNVPTKLTVFAAGLTVSFGAAFGVGALLDPTDDEPTGGGHAMAPAAEHGSDPAAESSSHGEDAAPGTPEHGADAASKQDATPTAALPGGLSVSQDGYAIVPERTRFAAGRPATLRFTVTDRRGQPVRDGYEVEAERELHLIVVRRDATGFQHLHPRRDPSGVWSVPLTLPDAGSYRMLADFTIAGDRRTLGVDLDVPGPFAPASPAAPSDTAAVDGLDVRLTGGPLRAGEHAAMDFRVTRDGRPVAGLQPYLGAKGHLVALREGDLGYLHVHPDEDDAPGTIPFMAEFPSPGRYRLFLQFQTGGTVHTAPLTVEVTR